MRWAYTAENRLQILIFYFVLSRLISNSVYWNWFACFRLPNFQLVELASHILNTQVVVLFLTSNWLNVVRSSTSHFRWSFSISSDYFVAFLQMKLCHHPNNSTVRKQVLVYAYFNAKSSMVVNCGAQRRSEDTFLHVL